MYKREVCVYVFLIKMKMNMIFLVLGRVELVLCCLSDY